MLLVLSSAAMRAIAAEPSETLEEVLVTGEHPGPGLWEVSRGDHSLWILGTHAPLPVRLEWRSQAVEWVITEAQEILGPYSVSFSLRDGNALAAKGPPLRRLLSRRTYARWRELKRRYIGANRDIETALPVTAALLLRSAAFEGAGLTNTDGVWRQIYQLAERYHVPVSATHQVDRVVYGDAAKNAQGQRAGVAYLTNTIENLEADLRASRSRANAWATGDLTALRAQAAADRDAAYLYAGSWPYLDDDELQALLAEADRRFLAAAEAALRRNRTTFAALPIFMLLREDGLLAALRAKGYTVDEPRE
jgi:TraB/PrgY/gumN family